jgi:hypothetical protein
MGLNTDYNALSIFKRLQRGEKASRNQALIKGRYSDAGYPDSRYQAELALVEELGWWFQDDLPIVWTIMDWVCQLNPQTDTGERRKWLEEDEEWRKALFDNDWFGSRQTFDLSVLRDPYQSRPDVSAVMIRLVREALCELERATTAEIVDHSRVDRGERQVQRALKQLGKEGSISSVREGNYIYYFPVDREPPDTNSFKE